MSSLSLCRGTARFDQNGPLRSPSHWGRYVCQLFAAVAGVVICASGGRAETATVAVATNFVATFEDLAPAFANQSGHAVKPVSGATGTLYAQISHGAPFDVFLSADQHTVDRLIADGAADAKTRLGYAAGRLVLWSRDALFAGGAPGDGATVLRAARFRHLAIANPELAPYGRAAREVLQSLEVWSQLRDNIVIGQNVGQAHALVATGNAELGFVAASALAAHRKTGASAKTEWRWDVPAQLHQPIQQDAILLNRGHTNPAALAFLAFLKSDVARRIIADHGYDMAAER